MQERLLARLFRFPRWLRNLPIFSMKNGRPSHIRDDHYAYLDLFRGVAALAVMSGHLRAFLLVSYADVPRPGFLWMAFYSFTGLGHQAVMIFFVLSGFLICRNISESVSAGRWSVSDYAIRRSSRLLIVLVPALILTALWDQIGIHWLHSPFYSGQLSNVYNLGPIPEEADALYSASTFLGNLLFLQTIVVPPFGTNSPLWSLAYEGWYYVLFPALYFAIRAGCSFSQRAFCAGLAALICAFLPLIILVYGLVWLMGYGVFLIYAARMRLSSTGKVLIVGIGAILAAAALAGSKRQQLPLSVRDLILGAAFAWLMLGTLWFPFPRWLRAASRMSASFSYTLYLVHFPFLAFLAALLLHNQRLKPGLAAGATFAVLFGITIAYAYCMYLLFERHTPAIQARIRIWVRRARTIAVGGTT